MKRGFAYLLLSLFILGVSTPSFADHRDNRRDNRRHEQRSNRPGNNQSKEHKQPEKNNHRPDKHQKPDVKPNHPQGPVGRPGAPVSPTRPGQSNLRPGAGAPVPPPAPVASPVMRPGQGSGFHAGPAMPPPPPPRLPDMVRYATRGCHDVAVWQVSPDTYLVKYRRGRRWYTQYVYPYAERYGSPTLISVNWQPQSLWTLIPPIQLNINL